MFSVNKITEKDGIYDLDLRHQLHPSLYHNLLLSAVPTISNTHAHSQSLVSLAAPQ